MSQATIKVIRETVPVYLSLKDLMVRTSGRDKYVKGNYEITLDYENTEYLGISFVYQLKIKSYNSQISMSALSFMQEP